MGGTKESQEQKDCKYGGAKECQKQKDARAAGWFGDTNESQKQKGDRHLKKTGLKRKQKEPLSVIAPKL
jgi:hypothetical protein